MEQGAEAAVQIHFSAQSHRTNAIMRTLTALTAIFLPLNLITGFFGMNFEFMPLIHSADGFWWVFGAMILLVIVVGIAKTTRTFQSQPVVYTTYSRAVRYAPRERLRCLRVAPSVRQLHPVRQQRARVVAAAHVSKAQGHQHSNQRDAQRRRTAPCGC